MTVFKQPSFELKAFNCPLCGVYAKQDWNVAAKYLGHHGIEINNIDFSHCQHCDDHTIWVNKKLIYPNYGIAPLPNIDMPVDVKFDYEEAKNIVSKSPRGSAALLRLAIQKLCKHLGEKGENLNTDISELVKKGLPEKLQQALDSVRVIGNNAVHPGLIDLKDDFEIANKLFVFINIICENQITQPKMINDFYTDTIPINLKNEIKKRDNK